jgi:hypothetical protein
MVTPKTAHLEPGDTATAETINGALTGDFEVIRIGAFDIIAGQGTTPAELRGIAAAFLDAARLREERTK